MSPRPPEGPPGYDFAPFFRELDEASWFEEDDLLKRLLRRHVSEADDAGTGTAGGWRERLREWGREASGRLRRLARESSRPENRPRIEHFDARGKRVDRILLPESTRRALDVVEGREGLGAVTGDPFLHYARVYLAGQNGEAGVACSVACTDGLVRVLEAHGGGEVHRRVLAQVRGSEPGRVVHGAQFVTEIQGGSDVPANRTRAEPADGGSYRLRGQKWFCSNVNADHYLVTARPEGAPEGPAGIGLFLVPARLPLDLAGRGARSAGPVRGNVPTDGSMHNPLSRNGHTVDRLKEKMGTRELATAEVTFRGARAWPVGPVDGGLPILLRHVLAPSRFGCVLFAASALRRAARVAGAYAGFREAFGRPIAEYPRVYGALERIREERRRALAAAFRLISLWEEARAAEGWTDPAGSPERSSRAALDWRIMLGLCKAELTRRATRLVHEAVMILGGNGIEESFSPLPRLHRDAVIMETWEGPYNVLLKQAMKDMDRFGVEPGAFAERTSGGAAGELAGRLRESLGGGHGDPDPVAFGPVARDLVSAFADRELRAAGG